jgi:hypothetical protein
MTRSKELLRAPVVVQLVLQRLMNVIVSNAATLASGEYPVADFISEL